MVTRRRIQKKNRRSRSTNRRSPNKRTNRRRTNRRTNRRSILKRKKNIKSNCRLKQKRVSMKSKKKGRMNMLNQLLQPQFNFEEYEKLVEKGEKELMEKEDLKKEEINEYESECEEYCVEYDSHLTKDQIYYLTNVQKELYIQYIKNLFGSIPMEAMEKYQRGQMVFSIDLSNQSILLVSPDHNVWGYKLLSNCTLQELKGFIE